MLETILQVVTNMQSFNHKMDNRLSNLEIKMEIIESNQMAAQQSSTTHDTNQDKSGATQEWTQRLENKIDDLSTCSQNLEAKFDNLRDQMEKQENQISQCSGELATVKKMAEESNTQLLEAVKALEALTEQGRDTDWKVGQVIMISSYGTTKLQEGLDSLTDKTSKDKSSLSKLMKNQIKGLSSQVSTQGDNVMAKIEEQTGTIESKMDTQCTELKETITSAMDTSPAEASGSDAPARTYSQEYSVSRYKAMSHLKPWGCHGFTDQISLTVDKDISLIGFTVYGSKSGKADISINMKLIHQSSGQVLATKSLTLTSDGSQVPYSVKFDEPVDVKANTLYTGSVKMKDIQSWHGIQGETKVHGEGGVTFNFTNSEGSSNQTDTMRGQIPNILYRIVV